MLFTLDIYNFTIMKWVFTNANLVKRIYYFWAYCWFVMYNNIHLYFILKWTFKAVKQYKIKRSSFHAQPFEYAFYHWLYCATSSINIMQYCWGEAVSFHRGNYSGTQIKNQKISSHQLHLSHWQDKTYWLGWTIIHTMLFFQRRMP